VGARDAPRDLDVLQLLVEDVCDKPVDWPRALSRLCAFSSSAAPAAASEGAGGVGGGSLERGGVRRPECLVDFGPGGGCGALRMTRHALKQLAPVDNCYFSEVRSARRGSAARVGLGAPYVRLVSGTGCTVCAPCEWDWVLLMCAL